MEWYTSIVQSQLNRSNTKKKGTEKGMLKEHRKMCLNRWRKMVDEKSGVRIFEQVQLPQSYRWLSLGMSSKRRQEIEELDYLQNCVAPPMCYKTNREIPYYHHMSMLDCWYIHHLAPQIPPNRTEYYLLLFITWCLKIILI